MYICTDICVCIVTCNFEKLLQQKHFILIFKKNFKRHFLIYVIVDGLTPL